MLKPEDTTHADLVACINALTEVVQELREDMAETREVVKLWQALETGGRVITWLAKLGVAVIGVYTVVRAAGAVLISFFPHGSHS